MCVGLTLRLLKKNNLGVNLMIRRKISILLYLFVEICRKKIEGKICIDEINAVIVK